MTTQAKPGLEAAARPDVWDGGTTTSPREDQRRAERAKRRVEWEKKTEKPLLVMAILMIPLLIVPALVDLTEAWARAFLVLDMLIWFAFALDYVVRLCIADDKRAFVKRNVFDLLIVVVPFLRPLRILRSARALRLLRLTRLVGFLGYAAQTARRLLRRHGLRWVLLFGMAFVVIAALAAWEAESGSGSTRIRDFGDSFWWAVTTAATMNYGDVYPSTTIGKALAFMLMLVGVTVITMVTAELAAHFVASDSRKAPEDLTLVDLDRKLDQLLERIAALEQATPPNQKTELPT